MGQGTGTRPGFGDTQEKVRELKQDSGFREGKGTGLGHLGSWAAALRAENGPGPVGQTLGAQGVRGGASRGATC